MIFTPAHRSTTLIRGLLCLALLQCTISVSAQSFNFEPVRPVIVSARTAGYGGAYSAVEAGFDTLTTNPAALAYVKKEWSFSRLAMQVSGPLFDLPAVFQSDDIPTAMLDLVGKNNGVYIGSSITGPLAFGKVDKNFGFGVFNRTLTTADIPSITKATVMTGEEILLVGGYGLTVYEKGPHSIALGLQMKGFFQSFIVETGTSITVLNTFVDANIDAIPTVLSTGFGVDVGALYRYGPRLSAGLTCKDFYTPVFSTRYANIGDYLGGTPDSDTMYDRLSPDLSLGVAYEIPVPEQWTTITGWKVMADYRDALAVFQPIHRNVILNFAFGTEMELLDVVSLRAGFRDAYLSTGLGLDLTVCKVDFAMYGTELGLDPGERALLNIAISLSFEY